MAAASSTRQRILDAATDLFGLRGVEATSLDTIASEVGVAKQTLLYWFPSKDDLVQAVLTAAVVEVSLVVDASIRASGDHPLDRIDAVVKAVFRQGVRRPALLGLVRELGRSTAGSSGRLQVAFEPLAARAVEYLRAEMARGRLRVADPRMVVALCYATVTGIATEPEALRAVGWQPTTADLRSLRTELLAFLRAALTPRT